MPADTAISSRSAVCGAHVATIVRTFVVASSVALAACGGGLVPVHNIQNAPVVAARGQTPSAQQVRDAIMRALVSRGWQVDREGPDGVVATMVTRGNSATVLVRYDSRAYSISYLDSSPGLKFNGASIHRRYNEWVEKLEKSIRKLLADVDYYPVQVVVPPPGAAIEAPPPAAEAAPATAFEAPPPPPPSDAVPPPPAAGAPDVAPHAVAPARGARPPKGSQSAAAASQQSAGGMVAPQAASAPHGAALNAPPQSAGAANASPQTGAARPAPGGVNTSQPAVAPKASPQSNAAVNAPRSAGAPQPNSPPGAPQLEAPPPPPPAPAARK